VFVTFGNDPPRHYEARLFAASQSVAPTEIASSPFARRASRNDAGEIADPVSKRRRGISPLAMAKEDCHQGTEPVQGLDKWY